MVAIFLSFFVAYIDWQQGFITSFIAVRSFLWLSFGYFLIKQDVKIIDLTKGLKLFAIGYILIVFLSNISPQLEILFKSPNYMNEKEVSDLFLGIEFIVFYFYFRLGGALESRTFSLKQILWLVVLFVVIILSDNRTTIFSLIAVTSYVLITDKRIKISYKVITIALVFPVAYFFIADTLSILVTQTLTELNNPEYNRIKSFYFLITEFSKSWLGYIFGNGFASLKSSYGQYVHTLKLQGIYQSDMGLIGLWSMFGVIAVYAIFKNIIFMIFKKKSHLAFRLQALHIIFGFLMYSFILEFQIAYFIILIYLFERVYNEKRKNPDFRLSSYI